MSSWSYTGGSKAKGKGKYQSQSWDTKGYGKGKKGGKQEEWQESWPEEAAKTIENKTTRIPGNYQFVKASLRTAADIDGSCLAGYSKKSGVKLADRAFVSKDHLKECLTIDNSHLLRRPGVGLSECAGSLRAGAAVLEAWTQEPTSLGFEFLHEAMTTPGMQAALRTLDTSDKKPRTVDDVRTAFDVIYKFSHSNKKLLETFGKMAIASSRLYVMAMHGLQLTAIVAKPKLWAELIPEDISEAKVLKKWRASPANEDLMVTSMATLVVEKVLNDDKWNKEGNAAAAVFGDWGTAKASSGSEDSDTETKRDNKNKDKKRKRSPSASVASSASSEKKRKSRKDDKHKKQNKDTKTKHKTKKKTTKQSSSSGDDSNAHKKSKPGGDQDTSAASDDERVFIKNKKNKKDIEAAASSDGTHRLVPTSEPLEPVLTADDGTLVIEAFATEADAE